MAVSFNQRMTQNALGIRTRDLDMQKPLEVKYEVKMTENNEHFYEGICKTVPIRIRALLLYQKRG